MNETAPTVDPHHTMLLVMDYQPAILNNRPEIFPRQARLISIADLSGLLEAR